MENTAFGLGRKEKIHGGDGNLENFCDDLEKLPETNVNKYPSC